jgi:hypothetical protein
MFCQSTPREFIQGSLIKIFPLELFSQNRRESGGYNLENANVSHDCDVIVTYPCHANTGTGTTVGGTVHFP